MSRYATMFERLEASDEGALGAFLVLGHPDAARCGKLLDSLVSGGADMIEVGIPFSDPVADGPVIQTASSRALASGIRVADCLDLIAGFRARHSEVPVGVLTYANIVMARGREKFFEALAEAGADSILVADVPSLEAAPFASAAAEAGLDWVMIAASNSSDEQLGRIAALTRSYTYCVTRFGVTGEAASPLASQAGLIERLEGVGAPPPVLGFGISEPGQVEGAIRSGAKGVIVGSALVALAQESDAAALIEAKVSQLKAATRLRPAGSA